MKRKFQVIQCDHCHKWIPLGNFCCHCGNVQANTSAEREVMECKFCKKIVAVGKFCTACGMEQGME